MTRESHCRIVELIPRPPAELLVCPPEPGCFVLVPKECAIHCVIIDITSVVLICGPN